MDYFKRLLQALSVEREEDRRQFHRLTQTLPVADRRENGMTWYPVAIRETEIGKGDYLTIELERTTHQDLLHQLRFGMSAALFSNHDAKKDRIEGTITHINGNRLKLSLREDELPDWTRNGKLGIDAVFDENSYDEMTRALQLAMQLAENKNEGRLVTILTGQKKPEFYSEGAAYIAQSLNMSQQEAVQKILQATDLAIVHGPPGTGKTTTLVQAVKAILAKERQQLLVVAPSNAAVDLLSEKLNDEGLNVVRVGNPARVNEKQLNLTLDSKISAHAGAKEIKRLRRQAAEYRDLAQKYKRSFGPAEREQRKALFNEARSIMKEVDRTEQYITDDILSKAQVITATLVGANHYSIRQRTYQTVIIDEAGQALEPACWIPILKAKKVIMAGDHQQLPPTIKSQEAGRVLGETLLEKCVRQHPQSVTLLQEQYRMHEMIMNFSSKEFYESKLQAHPGVARHLVLDGDQPVVFVDTAGCGFEEVVEGSGIANPEESGLLLKHLELFISEVTSSYNTENFPSIAVISPYRHQVERLKEDIRGIAALQPLLHSISVNTIDSFQGQERDVVYISMVRSNTDNSIGFLSDIRRMNVAMTRARKKLVVIGDSATLSQFPFYADFIQYAQEKNGYVSAWEFMM